MFGAKTPIDQSLLDLVAPVPPKASKRVNTTVAKCESTIASVANSETIHLLIVGTGNGVQPPDIVALTDSAAVEIYKRGVGRRFAWSDFGALMTRHNEHLGSFELWIQTRDGLMYSPGTVDWANNMIQMYVDGPDTVRSIDTTIAQLRAADGTQ